jgi:hypothetical protein
MSTIFRDITPCNPLKISRRFRGTSPPSSGSKNKPTIVKAGGKQSLWDWRWRQYVPPNCRLILKGLHGVIFQKLIAFITTAVRTANPKYDYSVWSFSLNCLVYLICLLYLMCLGYLISEMYLIFIFYSVHLKCLICVIFNLPNLLTPISCPSDLSASAYCSCVPSVCPVIFQSVRLIWVQLGYVRLS